MKKISLMVFSLSLCWGCYNPIANQDLSKIVVPIQVNGQFQTFLTSELTPKPKTETIKAELTPKPKTETIKAELTPKPKTETIKAETTALDLTPRPKTQTILTGRAYLPAGFKVSAIPEVPFKIQVFDLQGQLVGATESNSRGEYAVTQIPVNMRVKLVAQAIGRPTAKLMALIDVPVEVGGTALAQDINTTTTAIVLLAENAQENDSTLAHKSLKDLEALQPFVIKVEKLVMQFLEQQVDQAYGELKALKQLLQEIRREWEIAEHQLPIAPEPTPSPTPVEETPTPIPFKKLKEQPHNPELPSPDPACTEKKCQQDRESSLDHL